MRWLILNLKCLLLQLLNIGTYLMSLVSVDEKQAQLPPKEAQTNICEEFIKKNPFPVNPFLSIIVNICFVLVLQTLRYLIKQLQSCFELLVFFCFLNVKTMHDFELVIKHLN
jgi:hypothetical protein